MARPSKPQLARRLLELDEQIRALEQSGKTLRDERAAAREQLVAVAGLAPDTEQVIAGIRIRRRIVAGRLTYDITAAFEDKVITDGQLKPYEREGDPYEVWTVKRAVTPAEAEAAAKELLS
jgi:hypothetical protein